MTGVLSASNLTINNSISSEGRMSTESAISSNNGSITLHHQSKTMEETLAAFDFSTIGNQYVDEIKRTCLTFEHVTLHNLGQEAYITMPGSMLGFDHFMYYVMPAKNGLHIQACPLDSSNFYLGVYIVRENSEIEILPYLNNHRGEFT